MTKRILLAGIAGGLALFIWGGLSHTVLGLGQAGMQYLPQQQPVMQTLQASLPQSGFYMFPQADKAGNLPADRVGGAHGLLIYQPVGASAMRPAQLVNEAILDIILAILAAYLLSKAPGLTSYVARVGFVAVVGLIVALMTHVEYWNWYEFPATYTVANIFDNFVGFVIVGLCAAALVKPGAARVMTMPAKAA
ncbi:MAG TPA: hypothetical protein VHW45_05070 [Candidatus Sulfotelmatobacter sp.]|nr:hypothetical protein [Candidatus Sulfotelmatobacter sp.]